MGLKRFRPLTPTLRYKTLPDFSELTTNRPEKSLTESKRSTGGRNNQGRVSAWQRGGGHRRKYRIIDFRRRKLNIPARVSTIEYDPNRSARIALLAYVDGDKMYILAPDGLKAGDTVVSSRHADIKPGNALALRYIPLGTAIHNIELKIGKGGQLARSAGVSTQLVAKEGDYAQVRLPSGEVRRIHLDCRATIGQVSNTEHSSVFIGKAGRQRWLGRRPHNRGVTMNPVDHPMGGGEGRTSGGRHPCSPWGQLAKGMKTRNSKRTDWAIIRRRGKKG